MTKLLVATGQNGYQKSVEVVNLDESNPDLICDNLPDLPLGVRGATGQLYQGSIPIICGGFDDSYRSECHSLENGIWSPVANLSSGKGFMSSALLTDVSQDEDIFLITGGWNYPTVFDEVESFDGNSWSSDVFPPLPEAVNGHCTVAISNSVLFSIGGNTGYTFSGVTDRTFFFNVTEKKYIQGQHLKLARAYHSCGVLNWENPSTGNKEKVVVVAGITIYK